MNNLILHVGFPKSGTSAIQVALRKNDAMLYEHGIDYVLLDKREITAIQRRGYGSGNAIFFVEALKKKKPIQHLIDKVESSQSSTVLLSTEAFGQLTEEEAAPFINWLRSMSANLHITAYSRSPLDLVLSGYSQAVKLARMTHTLERACHAFIDPQQRIRNVFESFEIDERQFDVAKHDLVNNFLDWVVQDAPQIEHVKSSRTNRSLSMEEAAVVKKLNGSDMSNRDIESVVVALLANDMIGTPISHTEGSIAILCKKMGVDPAQFDGVVSDGPRSNAHYLQKVTMEVVGVLAAKVANYRQLLDKQGIDIDEIFKK